MMFRLILLLFLGISARPFHVMEPQSRSALAVASSQTTNAKVATVTPQEVFKTVSPSVYVVEALNSRGEVVAFGSGVAVGPDQVVTNKHVVDKGIRVRLKRGLSEWPARITHASAEYDLCRLAVEDLQARGLPVRRSSSLEIGERVYAIGTPKGLELTFSEGIISSLRDFPNGRIIQTSAPISPGSSGGGLFDAQGRLIGITTATLLEGQNLNFAIPGEWVLALERSPVPESTIEGEGRAQHQAMLWYVRAFEFFDQREYQQSIQACRNAIGLKPDFVEAWYVLGLTHGHLKQYEKAILAFREALRIKPDYAEPWQGIGLVNWDLGQHEEAIESFRQATRLKPDDDFAWYNLGAYYGKLHQSQNAIEAYRKAIRLKPDFVDAWFNLGIEYAIQGDRAKMMEVYQQLKLLDPGMADRFFNKVVLP